MEKINRESTHRSVSAWSQETSGIRRAQSCRDHIWQGPHYGSACLVRTGAKEETGNAATTAFQTPSEIEGWEVKVPSHFSSPLSAFGEQKLRGIQLIWETGNVVVQGSVLLWHRAEQEREQNKGQTCEWLTQRCLGKIKLKKQAVHIPLIRVSL